MTRLVLGAVKGFPAGWIVQVAVETLEEGCVKGNAAGFETVPETGGGGA